MFPLYGSIFIVQFQNRQTELHEQVRARVTAVDGQLAAGVTLLRQRLGELEMSDVETPSELLSRYLVCGL